MVAAVLAMTPVTSLARNSWARPAPRRLALPLTVLLAAVTVLALVRTAAVVSSPPAAPDPGAATAATVRRFYAAANAALAAGAAAVASVRLAGGTAGAPLVAQIPAGDGRWLDRFRVRDGRVAEVWDATASLEAATVLARTEVVALVGPGPIAVAEGGAR